MQLKISREEAYKLFEEAMEERDKIKLTAFILWCLYHNVKDEELFNRLLEITKIDIEEKE
jgi:hypothetical protein